MVAKTAAMSSTLDFTREGHPERDCTAFGGRAATQCSPDQANDCFDEVHQAHLISAIISLIRLVALMRCTELRLAELEQLSGACCNRKDLGAILSAQGDTHLMCSPALLCSGESPSLGCHVLPADAKLF
ncbi:hypothetical protein ABBQ38_014320 [Trebouxia sp. C0009 RCD-2024]